MKTADPGRSGGEGGTALVLVVLIVAMLLVLTATLTLTSTTRSVVALEGRYRVGALQAAESGLALTLQAISDSNGGVLDDANPDTITASPVTYTIPDGRAIVTTEYLAENGVDDDGDGVTDAGDADEEVVRVLARGQVDRGGGVVERAVEAYMRVEIPEPFRKALYVGNETGDPDYGMTFGASDGDPYAAPDPPPDPESDWDTAGHDDDGDYVEGDVHVNGDLELRGNTRSFGDLDATGDVTGEASQGSANPFTDPLNPPDLEAQGYEGIADSVIDESSSLPAWLRGEQGGDYYGNWFSDGDNHDLPHFHLGDQAGDIDLSASDRGTLVYVKGNLWVHTTTSLIENFPGATDVHITLVVEGNVFIADDIEYDGDDDGLLIIAKGKDGGGQDAETYTDLNQNYQYDDGEPILNDDGNGVYDGPQEGQGNIFYGDPRFGTGGVTDGFLYAQNNVYLVNEGTEGGFGADERVWGVEGFLSAGNQVLFGDRSSGSNYENYRVKYDDRFTRLNFKGIPQPFGGQFEGLTVVSWHEVPPETN